MKQEHDRGEDEGPMSLLKPEGPMEATTVPETRRVAPVTTCAHSRVIDDVLTRDGKRTGKVRCLECGGKFNDPYNPPNG